MNKVAVTLKVIEGKGEEFLQTMRHLQEKLKHEEGFHKCVICRDVTEEGTFNVIEEWKTQEHLDNFLKSDLFRVLVGALKVLSTESEVRYHLVSDDRNQDIQGNTEAGNR